MKVKELIKKLKSCNQNDNVIFYHLKNYDLQQANVESIINVKDCNQVEITTTIDRDVVWIKKNILTPGKHPLELVK